MARFWSADWHIFHKKIIEYSNRPFSSVEEMVEALIRNHNSVVGPDDEFYNLGDFSFGTADQTESVLKRLSGKHFLIRGNHDEPKNTLSPQCAKYFEWIKDYYELMVEDPDTTSGSRRLVMCHYPLLTWNGAHKVSKRNNEPTTFCLNGHCHGSIDYLNKNTTRWDVGVDTNNYTPLSYEQLKQIMKGKKYTLVDHHGKPDKYKIRDEQNT